MIAPFLFISGVEIAFIIFIVIMVFGADKVPEIARGLGKGMRQLKDATNDIKSEITKSAEGHGIDIDVTKDIKKEIDKAKEDINDITGPVKRNFLMWEQLEQWDRELFIYLNGLGIEKYDTFWIFVTKIEHWIPWYLFLLSLFFIVYKRRQAIIGVLLSVGVVGLSLGITEVVKNGVARLRPSNNLDIADLIRVLQSPNNFSFFSGHAAVSMALTTFMVLALRHQLKWIYVIYIWPLLFMTSRIYVGVHFPGDIMVGSLVGVVIGLALWKSAGRRWIQFA